MKLLEFSTYGSPNKLKLREVEKPLPKDNEVLVKIFAASINSWDLELLKGGVINRLLYGVHKPIIKTLGSDISGCVEVVGKNVTQFRPKDEVWGDLSNCGWGGFAQYVCVPENAIGQKPKNITHIEAAAAPQAGLLALQGLSDLVNMQPGKKVLINGAGGGVGTFAVQIAKSLGAEVTAVDHTEKLHMIYSLGANRTIDYTRRDFTKVGDKYDFILDVLTDRSAAAYAGALCSGGAYVSIGGSLGAISQVLIFGLWYKTVERKKMWMLTYRPNKGLADLKVLIENKKITPIIDSIFGLQDIPSALEYFKQGTHQGKIIISIH